MEIQKNLQNKKLKSCPFCNGIANVHTTCINNYWVECSCCGIKTTISSQQSKVVSAWNKRVKERGD